MSEENLTPAQASLRRTWEEHLRHEFETKNTEETLTTMIEDAHVNHVPVMTGGVGREGLREFYSKRFISQMPPDVASPYARFPLPQPADRWFNEAELNQHAGPVPISSWTTASVPRRFRAVLDRDSEKIDGGRAIGGDE